MDFEPPAKPYGDRGNSSVAPNKFEENNRFQIKEDCSPLLRTFPNNNYKNGPGGTQNRNNQHFKTPIYSRLGSRSNFQPRYNNNQDQIQNNNVNVGPRNFNRKRQGSGAGSNEGPPKPKRMWGPKKVPYYNKNTNNNQQNHNIAQNRLDRIRRNSLQGSSEQLEVKNEVYDTPDNSSYLNESHEIDATDITVQVVNHAAQAVKNENVLERFKMILNPKAQAAIQYIQSKRKDKQVIFPFPVTPSITGISLHERFSLL